MKTKLTLSIEKELVRFAHEQAHSSGKSISDLFSEFLLLRKTKLTNKKTSKIAAMRGSLKTYTINDSKTAIRQAYAKKYSR